jgi:hypothetical protein
MAEKIVTKERAGRNEYVCTLDGVWVRNFCKPAAPYIDINRLVPETEYEMLMNNELENLKRKYVNIEAETLVRKKIVIVSDGYDFAERQKMLAKLPANEVTVIGVNKSLAKWELVGDDCPAHLKRAMAFYVVNNPYPEAELFLPAKRYYPKCVASVRTHPPFLQAYKGNIYTYAPVPESRYAGPSVTHEFMVDDYRNPVCAALALAYRFGGQKVMLFCCDDAFEGDRPGAERLENGLYTYPQHLQGQRIIDGGLFWLSHAKIDVADFSSGPKFRNAAYISDEKAMKEFFAG